MPDYFIGLLSGTSVDSIDAAVVDLESDNCKLVHTHSHPIPSDLRAELIAAGQCREMTLDALGLLDARLGNLLADAVEALLSSSGLEARQIRAVGSHGQTIRHRPELNPRFTWQIGDPTRITERTRIMTVSDFRRRDIAAGGEGAPLAPLFHRFRFNAAGETRAVVNIGGIANITLLPADATTPTTGFDCGPGNLLLDGWVQKHRAEPFDRNGEWGATGAPSESLLHQLLGTDYLHQPPPKSTGRELFNMNWLQQRLEGFAIAAEDVQATLVEFTARTITDALKRFAPGCQRVLICGGGANNPLLMARLAQYIDIPVESTGQHGLPPEWVEAAAFAWLAHRTIQSLPSDTPPVTGATHPVILGAIYPA